MEPSNDDADTFFDEILSMKVKDKMTNVTKETSETNHNQMGEEDHHNGKTESRIDISIDRSEIVMKSWEKSKHPIKKETVEVCAEDVDKHSSYKPETLIEWEIVSEKWLKESLHMLHDEEAR